MHRNRRNRPLTPLVRLAFIPLAFWLTRFRRVFDAVLPEPTKYKYRVADAEKDAEKEET